MSLRDDSLPPNPSSKFTKGHKGSNQYTKAQQSDPSPDTDTPSPDFDAAIIKAAHSYGSGTKVKMGLAGYCANLRDTRPVEYATLLSKALARKAEASYDSNTVNPGVQIFFTTAPAGMYIDADGKLIEAEGARAEWARKTGHQDEPPPPSPLSKPVLVARSDEHTTNTREAADNEILFGGFDDGDEADQD